MPRIRCSLAAVLALLCLGAAAMGCASRRTAGPTGEGAGSAEQAVRGFLGALAARDYQRMARYFGTASGRAEERWGEEEVEQRMMVLAGVLEHATASVAPARLSGGGGEARARFSVTLTETRYGTVRVPVTAVRARSGRWFVEQIDTSVLRP